MKAREAFGIVSTPAAQVGGRIRRRAHLQESRHRAEAAAFDAQLEAGARWRDLRQGCWGNQISASRAKTLVQNRPLGIWIEPWGHWQRSGR